MENIQGIFYINLDHRTDRRKLFEDECTNMGISAEHFSAFRTSPGYIGCQKSHIEILKIAKERNLENIIIFEDDFKFLVNKETFHGLIKNFFDLGIPYDVVMLSYNLYHGCDFNSIVGKVIY